MMQSSDKRRAGVLDGAPVAEQIKREVRLEVDEMLRTFRVRPSLAVVRVGDDAASALYVNNKVRTSREIGLDSEQHALPGTTTTDDLLSLIHELNARDDIDGLLIQLPLPPQIDTGLILEAVDPSKDVDGFHPLNVGRMVLGQTTLIPCTPAGIIQLLKRSSIPIRGANACVVGRSNIVGRPLAQLLLRDDATVSICHSQTRDLGQYTRIADILIVAIGSPGLIKATHIKPGATVIDVGMNKVTDPDRIVGLFGEEAEKRLGTLAKRGYALVGDVHPAEADQIAGLRTPVPGGVGLLTIAMLMRNTVTAARWRRALPM